MSYQVLARKWRPKTFSEMVGQEHTLKALINAFEQGRLHHAYLFTGTRGVGKTTLARIIAKCFNCEKGVSSKPCGECSACQEIDKGCFIDLLEIDAASRTRVEDTRELLDNVPYAPTSGRYKIYLIDEVHMLSNHSFNALLKTLEEPPAHVKFLLATTDPQKLPVTILSRCLQFHLKNLTSELIKQQLTYVLQQEKIFYDAQALEQLANAADGSMRDALSLLDQAIAYGNEKVLLEDVNAMLGYVADSIIHQLLKALLQHDGQQLLQLSSQLAEIGADFNNTLEALLSTLHQISIKQTISTLNSPPMIAELSQQITSETLQLFYQIALIGRRDLPLAPTPRIGFEMVLLRMLTFNPVAPTTQPFVSATPIVENKKFDWPIVLSKLNFKGLTYALASHCSLISSHDNCWQFTLSAEQAPLLNEIQRERIQQSLQQYYNEPIMVQITVVQENNVDSPAQQKNQQQRLQQDAAVSAIKNDDNLLALLEEFNGQIDHQSINAIEPIVLPEDN